MATLKYSKRKLTEVIAIKVMVINYAFLMAEQLWEKQKTASFVSTIIFCALGGMGIDGDPFHAELAHRALNLPDRRLTHGRVDTGESEQAVGVGLHTLVHVVITECVHGRLPAGEDGLRDSCFVQGLDKRL